MFNFNCISSQSAFAFTQPQRLAKMYMLLWTNNISKALIIYNAFFFFYCDFANRLFDRIQGPNL